MPRGQLPKNITYTPKLQVVNVDLFGAQLHELPFIWEELNAVGFESGHAYKSLRTVKSCR